MDQALICLGRKNPLEVYMKQDRFRNIDIQEPEILNEDQQLYFEKVLAHRTYQYAVSIYAEIRYKGGDKRDSTLTWHKVDAWLRKGIERY